MLANFNKKTVLITGGTRGIGLSTALLFAKLGAQCIIIYRWGAEDERAISDDFLKMGALAPILFQADVANKDDTERLLKFLKEDAGLRQIDVLVSNVSSSAIINSFDDYSLRALEKSIRYSAWPVISYSKQIRNAFGRYPKYIIAVSSTGPAHYTYGYDYVAFTKTVMETLCKYMAHRLKHEKVLVHAVRSRAIKTKSLEDTFGKELFQFAQNLVPDSYWIQPEEVAGVIVMLCSGLLDAMNGQIITVDRGTSFFDNIMDLYTRRASLPIFNQ
ncbi:MAG: SDR family oxidoreductase [Amoebophilaceae bacterium]|jgi:NAD(P)-dependent dehydrogenase (short-subunit alcohol dehydrogenase family)|nr:SDR family oxidoreductase [Amoebophilaceae bacterium]